VVRGIDASRAFYDRAVAPLLDGIPHAAGRIGRGSDVVGLDDEMSQDHDWGDRVTVITSHATPALPDGVELYTLDSFVASHLGVDPIDDIDWLLVTGQSVLEVIAGRVFRDDTGELTALRTKLQWYPADVEAYLVACAWKRIDQELPFIGRTRDRGDAQGSEVLCARTARNVMHLTFLLERQWPPYPKWFGTAYGTRPPLDSEEAICAALDELAGRPVTVPFHDRPFKTIDPRFLASMPCDGIGSVEMWIDNVDVLANPARRMALRGVYERWRGER
jgi:hypothetical protein